MLSCKDETETVIQFGSVCVNIVRRGNVYFAYLLPGRDLITMSEDRLELIKYCEEKYE